MDFWLIELWTSERRADIQREVVRFRVSAQALPEQNWFGQRMHALGLLLVSTGERLCQRYSWNESKTVLKGL